MLNLSSRQEILDEGLECVYSAGAVAIYSISHNSLQIDKRSSAYQERFKEFNSSKLTDFDRASSHFEIWEGAICLGGFRLSPIGDGASEVEEVFNDFRFASDSFELGRLWMKVQRQGHGRKCMETIYQWLAQEGLVVYFKQSSLLGGVSKNLGAASEGIYSWNPRLGYQVELFSVGVRNND